MNWFSRIEPLEELGIFVERLERGDRPRRANERREPNGEETDVGADVEDVIAGPHHAARELQLGLLELIPQNREPDGVVREIHEHPDAVLELLDDQRPGVGLREIRVLVLVFTRRDDIGAELLVSTDNPSASG